MRGVVQVFGRLLYAIKSANGTDATAFPSCLINDNAITEGNGIASLDMLRSYFRNEKCFRRNCGEENNRKT
jgi:hypothetical protein